MITPHVMYAKFMTLFSGARRSSVNLCITCSTDVPSTCFARSSNDMHSHDHENPEKSENHVCVCGSCAFHRNEGSKRLLITTWRSSQHGTAGCVGLSWQTEFLFSLFLHFSCLRDDPRGRSVARDNFQMSYAGRTVRAE